MKAQPHEPLCRGDALEGRIQWSWWLSNLCGVLTHHQTHNKCCGDALIHEAAGADCGVAREAIAWKVSNPYQSVHSSPECSTSNSVPNQCTWKGSGRWSQCSNARMSSWLPVSAPPFPLQRDHNRCLRREPEDGSSPFFCVHPSASQTIVNVLLQIITQ